jgi:hypothetical protein
MDFANLNIHYIIILGNERIKIIVRACVRIKNNIIKSAYLLLCIR